MNTVTKELVYNKSYIILWGDKRITFGHWEAWGDYQFDLYSEVGELWSADIDYIMAKHNILLAILDTSDAYCNTWVSYHD